MGEKRTRAEIDPTILKTVLDVLSLGVGKRDAAITAGISHETLYTYLERGKAAWEKDEDERTERDQFWADFYIKVEQAQTKPKVYLLGMLQKAAHGDWKAGAWLLEKLFPKEFSPKLDISANVESKHVVTHDLAKLSGEELLQLKALRDKMDAPE